MYKEYRDKFHRLGFTRYKRIRNYIEHIESKIELKSDKDKQIVNELTILIDDRVNRLEKIHVANAFFYFAIYFSVFSLFFSKFIFLSEFTRLITEMISFFGTAVFFIGLFFTTRLKDLYYQDLNLLSSHLISVYNKKEVKEDNLFDESNSYNVFINFFKKRGF